MNKVFLIGNLTRDPEARMTPSGVAVTTFNIAVNRPVANQQGDKEVDFFGIVTWRKLAENCAKFLSKGKKVSVIGRLQTRSYDSNGQKRWVTEVIADEVEFLSTRNGEERDGREAPAPQNKAPQTSNDDFTTINDEDEIPF
jgi:single-strand DNA-binding protein